MKFLAALIALALAAPTPALAQVFRSEPTIKKSSKAKGARRGKAKQSVAKSGKATSKSSGKSKAARVSGDSKLTDGDVVVIIEGQ